MSFHRPDCVLFDAGCVLMAVEFANLASHLKKRAGLEPEQVRAVFTDDDLARSYELGRLTDDEFCRRILLRLGVDISQEDLVEAWNSIIGDPVVPEEILAALSLQCQLWVVSNTNRLHFNHIRRHYPYLKYFRGCILSYESGMAKPEPGIFELALARAGVSAADCLFIDDQPDNIAAAKALGITAIQFFNPPALAEDLRLLGLLG